jgi:hypothetical protein
MRLIVPILVLAVGAAMAQTSIDGVVRDASTKGPMAEVDIFASPGQIQTTTDTQGRYVLHGLNPDRYTIHAYSGHGRGGRASKVITLSAGQDLGSVDFYLRTPGEISGKVLDQNKEPLAGITVFLVAREYSFGTLRYVYAEAATTNDQGEYRLRRADPGRAYLLMAEKRTKMLDAISDVPGDPKLRKLSYAATYYPDTPSMYGAQSIALRAGEHREGIDIHMARGPSFCIDGVLEASGAPAPLRFSIRAQQPTSGNSGDGGFHKIPSGGQAGNDGRFRICDLMPGEYQMWAMRFGANAQSPPPFFGVRPVTITDQDVHKIQVDGHPQAPVAGEIVWAATAPDKPVSNKLSIWLQPLTRAQWGGEQLFADASIPGEFSLALFTDEYIVHINGFPDGCYMKDVTYGGVSIKHEPLRVGSMLANATLRVVVGRDGGSISAKVADKDSHPVSDANVVVMPAESSSEASLAAALRSGQTDQNGLYLSGSVAPGKYLVLASAAPVDMSPESIGSLWRALTHAQEVEVAPNQTVQVAMDLTTLP